MTIRKFVAVAAAASGLALFAAGPTGTAGASTTDDAALAALKELCEDRGGLPVWSPYALSRCQGARANKGFDAERSICEGLGDAAFQLTLSTTRMNRASWACVSTVPVR